MEVPVLITKSCYFNFLREFWLANTNSNISPKELLLKAKEAYFELSDHEMSQYDEDIYIGTRLFTDVVELQTISNMEINEKLKKKITKKRNKKMIKNQRQTRKTPNKIKSKPKINRVKRSSTKFKPKPLNTRRTQTKAAKSKSTKKTK